MLRFSNQAPPESDAAKKHLSKSSIHTSMPFINAPNSTTTVPSSTTITATTASAATTNIPKSPSYVANVDIVDDVTSSNNNRSLHIKRSGSAELVLYLRDGALWTIAERLRDTFVESDCIDEGGENNCELLLNFIQHTIDHLAQTSPFMVEGVEELLCNLMVFLTTNVNFLHNRDPHHQFPKILSSMDIRDALRIYMELLAIVGPACTLSPLTSSSSSSSPPPTPSNTLLEEGLCGKKKIVAAFGGQGNTDSLLDELIELHYVYKPLIREFLLSITPSLLKPWSCSTEVVETLTGGFDVIGWIDSVLPRPPSSYLINPAISLPLVGLIQILNYYIMSRLAGPLTMGEMRKRFSPKVIGHSQGIVVAAIISSATTEEEFIKQSVKGLQLLFWIGFRSQQHYHLNTLDPSIVGDSISNGEGSPTPMLSVRDLPLCKLEKAIAICNKHHPSSMGIVISLSNGPRSYAVSGHPKTLYGLNVLLRKDKGSPGDQSRLPWNERKAVFSTKFLPIGTPFHSPFLAGAIQPILDDIERHSLYLSALKGGSKILNTEDGSVLASADSVSLTKEIVSLICVRKVDWITVLKKMLDGTGTGDGNGNANIGKEMPISNSDGITHMMDFGPGHSSGIGALSLRTLDGLGVQIVLGGTLLTTPATSNPGHDFQGKDMIFSSYFAENSHHRPHSTSPSNWEKDFSPRLVNDLSTGRDVILTKFSALIGKPPLMVAGMTPSTISASFVASCSSSGYHVELSGGGHWNEGMLREKIVEIRSLIPPGIGITVNCLYLNQRQWSFQFPLLLRMRREEGVVVEGITIAAGVPSLPVAKEIIEMARQSSLKHISFKPGTLSSIMDVVQIARHANSFPIILQWTGGRAGGHHSYEDVHSPLLEAYGAIRSVPNITLVVGSGFGDGEGSLPYLKGTWSLPFERPMMPVDGILMGSRLMVAKEGSASPEVKDLIVATAGIPPSLQETWSASYAKGKEGAGGIVTVISEMGEPIHKIATRQVLLWKELDERLFKLPRGGEERRAFMKNNREYIIERLNADSCKPWFGRAISCTDDAFVVRKENCELSELTYQDCLHRLAELLFIPAKQDGNDADGVIAKKERWIDPTWQSLFLDVLRRTEERLSSEGGSSCVSNHPQGNPFALLKSLDLQGAFMSRHTTLLVEEDVQFFLSLMKNPTIKPVPFIAVLDDDFEFTFKKDSLWQSEDLDAVPYRDVQRVCILHGPVACHFCTTKDLSVAEIMGGIVDHWIADLKRPKSSGLLSETAAATPDVVVEQRAWLSCPTAGCSLKEGIISVPKGQSLLSHIPEGNWLSLFLKTESLLRDRVLFPNQLKDLFSSTDEQTFLVNLSNEGQEALTMVDKDGKALCSIERKKSSNITIRVWEENPHRQQSSERVCLELFLIFDPSTPSYPFLEVMEGRNKRIKEFYWMIWFGSMDGFAETYASSPIRSTFSSPSGSPIELESASIDRFLRIVKNNNFSQKCPMDYGIVCCWPSIIRAIMPEEVDGDILSLVHLSNRITLLDESSSLERGDSISSESLITSIEWTPTGKIVEVECLGFRTENRAMVLKIRTKFFYRGNFPKTDLYFRLSRQWTSSMDVASKEQNEILKDKPYIKWGANSFFSVGSQLIFKGDHFHLLKGDAIHALRAKGTISLKTDAKVWDVIGEYEVGDCDGFGFGSGDGVDGGVDGSAGSGDFTTTPTQTTTKTAIWKKDPIFAFLERYPGPPLKDKVILLERPIPLLKDDDELSRLCTIGSNDIYSAVSGDHNPIHTNPLFSLLASLPAPITHGMWTSAAIKALIETFCTNNEPNLIRDYEVNFKEILLPGQEIKTSLVHYGMKEGRKLIKVEGRRSEDDVLVVDGTAEINPPPTAYLFTGQGSQEVMMGMDLYETSPVARDIWEGADKHFMERYGFSILNIVKKNPTSLTVHFGGPKGEKIRENYQEMRYDITDPATKVKRSISLFPGIDSSSESYTFNNANGLLYATQFTQPALTLQEKASFEDMRARGLVPSSHSSSGLCFAGHSLGEYAALAAVGNVLPIGKLCDIVFYRGLTMQVAVDRDEEGRSEFGMVAVNPMLIVPPTASSILKKKRMSMLPSLMLDISTKLDNRLLEIVNYNVEGWQYVVAGDLFALEVLMNALNALSSSLDEELDLDLCISRTQYPLNGRLQRGAASIPLDGIDVPFHSSFLLSGVDAFRQGLQTRILQNNIDLSLLEGHYIPNLTGTTFQVTKEYLLLIDKKCSSPIIKELIRSFPAQLECPEEKQRISCLMLIELLAYQFASPVQWIRTQEELFSLLSIERTIEIGPSPILTGMANRTLKLIYKEGDDVLTRRRELLSYAKNKDDIYYVKYDDDEEDVVSGGNGNDGRSLEITLNPIVSSSSSDDSQHIKKEPQQRQQKATSVLNELPFGTLGVLQSIVAVKLKKASPTQIQASKSVKELSAGKSTLQNELIADFQREFGVDIIPDRAEELSLQELSSKIGKPIFELGKHCSALIGKMFSSRFPTSLGQSGTKEYMKDRWGLEGKAADQILLFSLPAEPTKRLSSDKEVYQWIDKQCEVFFVENAIPLPSFSSSPSGSSSVSASNATLTREQLKEINERSSKVFDGFTEVLMESSGNASLIDRLRHKGSVDSESITKLQHQNDRWVQEHGELYWDGLKSIFSLDYIRKYDSSWNFSKQSVMILYADILQGRLKNVDREVTKKCLRVMNRSSKDLLKFMNYWVYEKSNDDADGDQMNVIGNKSDYRLARHYGRMLIERVQEALAMNPVYKDVELHGRPELTISPDGSIIYEEVRRHSHSSSKSFVDEIQGSFVCGISSVNASVEVGDDLGGENTASATTSTKSASETHRKPLVMMKKLQGKSRTFVYDKEESENYYSVLRRMSLDGISFCGKTALVTGAGSGSIGFEVVKGLLSGGARVIVTTSSWSPKTISSFRSLSQEMMAKGSSLHLVPCNIASHTDLLSLTSFIYDKLDGGDVDFIVPFAAISEQSRSLEDIDDRSLLSLRIMLTQPLRLFGSIAAEKRKRSIESRPATILIPLSPNQGNFGGDGLYGESKMALQALLARWSSETWSPYLSLCGCTIGWVRGTGLMNENNILAPGIEERGIRTFTSGEMAFLLLGLLGPEMRRKASVKPLMADLSGGLMDRVQPSQLGPLLKELRLSIQERSSIIKALSDERDKERSNLLNDSDKVDDDHPGSLALPTKKHQHHQHIIHRTSAAVDRSMGEFYSIQPNQPLLEMMDLKKVVVVVGMGELGPWGNARTRWEMEADGCWGAEGLKEMCFLMGLISWDSSKSTWCDSSTKKTIPSSSPDFIKAYQERVLAGCGIRKMKAEHFLSGYDPSAKEVLQECTLVRDLPPMPLPSKEEADSFLQSHNGTATSYYDEARSEWMVVLKKGSIVQLPRSFASERRIGGMLPDGFDIGRMGLQKEISSTIDPVSHYVMCATAEAFQSAGIVDPYELYRYIHPTELANCVGGGEGGMTNLRAIFRERHEGISGLQSDALQESFINTMPAWLNLLMLSASGPIQTPVGACATALQSLSLGRDCILTGKARVALVGGCDDLTEESSWEFGMMSATSNSNAEQRKGRWPSEASRPMTETRSGFMESQGAGVQLLMDAELALEMGVPILGIVGECTTAMDRQGRSVPAPGIGLLSSAKCVRGSREHLYERISFEERKENLDRAISKHFKEFEERTKEDPFKQRIHLQTFEEQVRKEKMMFGNMEFVESKNISRLERSLLQWNLTVDDIAISSFHGTSTAANDINESKVVQQQMKHLRRKEGNILPVICQKWLTGHPKGAAAAWMLNGLLQSMNDNIIPGNRNLDNVDPALKANDLLLYPSQTIRPLEAIKAGMMKSFGFGQVGGEAIILNKDLLLNSLPERKGKVYRQERCKRLHTSKRWRDLVLMEKEPLIKVKEHAPYGGRNEMAMEEVLLSPGARASGDEHRFLKMELHNCLTDTTTDTTTATTTSIGTDVQLVTDLPSAIEDPFWQRNFTDREIEQAMRNADPITSLAGKWAAKEAIIKALCQRHRSNAGSGGASDGECASLQLPSWYGGPSAPLIDIEIMSNPIPTATFSKSLLNSSDAHSSLPPSSKIILSISHSGDYALAVCNILQ